MDFNEKVLKPIITDGALKKYNDKGLHLTFKSKSGDHEFSGKLDNKGKGVGTYKGKWMGFDVSKELESTG